MPPAIARAIFPLTKSVAGAALVYCAGFAAIGSGASVGATALLYEGKSHAVIANVGGGIGLERNVAGGHGAVSLQW